MSTMIHNSSESSALSNVRRGRRNGAVLVYAMSLMVVLLGIGTVAVDWGHVQLAKTELMGATDAAARAGVAGLAQSPSDAYDQAIWAASLNRVDGTPVELKNSDIEIGLW